MRRTCGSDCVKTAVQLQVVLSHVRNGLGKRRPAEIDAGPGHRATCHERAFWSGLDLAGEVPVQVELFRGHVCRERFAQLQRLGHSLHRCKIDPGIGLDRVGLDVLALDLVGSSLTGRWLRPCVTGVSAGIRLSRLCKRPGPGPCRAARTPVPAVRSAPRPEGTGCRAVREGRRGSASACRGRKEAS